MHTITRVAFMAYMFIVFCSFIPAKKTQRILVFTSTRGFKHASIPAGVAAVQQLGAENNFLVDVTADASMFTKKNLKQYAAVMFLNTTGNVLNDEQQAVFEKYIHSGKGFVGVHAAADTEYDWPWYNELVGAYFKSHPRQQEAVLTVTEATDPTVSHLPAKWKRFDEWYNFKSIRNGLHVVLTIDEKSYSGGENGDVHPMAWYREVNGGRAYYTALGHTDESYKDPLFLKHLLGGIQYAMTK